MEEENGKFIISLDFELYWGVRDRKTINQYKKNLLGVREAIPAILDTFKKFGVCATFLIVGFLFFPSNTELLNGIPDIIPDYENKRLSPYKNIKKIIGVSEQNDPYRYAPSLIEKIRECPGQEIGCHTFSHYYCLENGQSPATFRSDLEAAQKIAGKYDITLKSLAFPRNQYNQKYLSVCREAGFTSFRGNEKSWLYTARNRDEEKLFRRALRLADSYINISGHNCYSTEKIASVFPYNIPSSRFLYPYEKKMSFFDILKLRRIRTGMTYAAKNNLVYHLWWHPHNFGTNLEKNIAFLEKILVHYDKLEKKYNFKSVTMSELAQSIENKNRV